MTSIRTIYEGLNGPYRTGPLQPPNVNPSQPIQPRMSMPTPISSVPGPPTPMPTTTQQNKKTNVQIPVARTSLQPIPAGSIVFTERQPHYHGPMGGNGKGTHTPMHVIDMRQLNAHLAATTTKAVSEGGSFDDGRACRKTMHQAALGGLIDEFPWTLDGLVNNSETDLGTVLESSFGSSSILVNVASQGPCQCLNNDEQQRCERKKSHAGSVLYVGVWKRIYVPYPLTPGSANEQKWQGFLATAQPSDPNNANYNDVVKELRCTKHVTAFSSAQLTSGEYKVSSPKGAFPNSMVHDVILINPAFLGTVLAGELAGPNMHRIKAFVGTGSLFGSWGFDYLIDLYKLGSSMDSNQAASGGVLTVNVCIESLPRFSALDKDAIDELSLVQGPRGYYHLLRMGIGGQTESLQTLYDAGPILNPALVAEVTQMVNGTGVAAEAERSDVYRALLRNPKTLSSTTRALMGLYRTRTIAEILREALLHDLHGLCRALAGTPGYSQLADQAVLDRWDGAVTRRLILPVEGRPHLSEWLHSRWVAPELHTGKLHGLQN